MIMIGDFDGKLEQLVAGMYAGWKIGKKPGALYNPKNVAVLEAAVLAEAQKIQPSFKKLEIAVSRKVTRHVLSFTGDRWPQRFTVDFSSGTCARHYNY